MNRLIHPFQLVAFTAVLFASMANLSGIEGTYVLVDGENKSEARKPKLTINVDNEGNYTATWTTSDGSNIPTTDIKVLMNEFETTFVVEASQDDFTFTYSGTFENGSLRGMVSTDIVGTFELIGILETNLDEGEYDKISIDKAIEECYVEITGKPMDNIQRITRELDSKLEECVNARVSSPKRIELQYAASERGLVPQVREEELDER
ncbi:MAG: hypothetical protein OXH84_04590 [Gammaproteobacteria bacterium]|nr:hypothetical protein [Gammaproteobacteria bacterium]